MKKVSWENTGQAKTREQNKQSHLLFESFLTNLF